MILATHPPARVWTSGWTERFRSSMIQPNHSRELGSSLAPAYCLVSVHASNTISLPLSVHYAARSAPFATVLARCGSLGFRADPSACHAELRGHPSLGAE